MNGEVIKLAKYICSFNTDIDVEAYTNQLNMLYGVVCEVGAFEPIMFDEVFEIESSRIKKYGASIAKQLVNAEMVVFEYSKIAYDLAVNSLYSNRAYHIAVPLKSVLIELVSSDLIEQDRQANLKTMISESMLDFEYAAGNHNVSSLRMAQRIREYKAQNGGK